MSLIKKGILSLFLLSSYLNSFALFIGEEDWDVVDYDTSALSTIIIMGIIVGLVIILLLYVNIRDFSKDPKDWKNKRAMDMAILFKKRYRVKEDAKVYGYKGKYYDLPIEIKRGEKCIITDTPNQAGVLGVKMLDEDKYRGKLAVNISLLERDNKR